MYGEARQAALLLGAASVMREGLGIPLARWDQADWDQAVANVRAAMGQAFDAAWEAGRLLTLNQTVEAALGK
jgi:hypothetical protein